MNLRKIKKDLDVIGFKTGLIDDCIVMLSETPAGNDIGYNIYINDNQLYISCKTFRKFGMHREADELHSILNMLNEKFSYYKFLMSDIHEIMMQYTIPAKYIDTTEFVLAMMFAAAEIVDAMSRENIGTYSGC